MHTYVTLEVSQSTYDEIAGELRNAGYLDDAKNHQGEIDMHGLALVLKDQSPTPSLQTLCVDEGCPHPGTPHVCCDMKAARATLVASMDAAAANGDEEDRLVWEQKIAEHDRATPSSTRHPGLQEALSRLYQWARAVHGDDKVIYSGDHPLALARAALGETE